MKRILEFRPAARRDFDEASDWYKDQDHAIRDRFVAAVDGAIESIIDSPLSFPVVRGSHARRAIVKKFPFAIFFSVERDRIIIYSVFHTSRNPNIWRARTG